MARARILRVASVVFVTVLVGVFIGLVWPLDVGGSRLVAVAASREGEERLQQARAAAPFVIRAPNVLPAQTRLHDVAWSEGATRGHFTVDIWYVSPEGGYLHVWQTDIPASTLQDAEKDPVSSPFGEAIQVGGHTWRMRGVFYKDGISVALRLDDGITYSIDTNMGRDELVRVASSIR